MWHQMPLSLCEHKKNSTLKQNCIHTQHAFVAKQFFLHSKLFEFSSSAMLLWSFNSDCFLSKTFSANQICRRTERRKTISSYYQKTNCIRQRIFVSRRNKITKRQESNRENRKRQDKREDRNATKCVLFKEHLVTARVTMQPTIVDDHLELQTDVARRSSQQFYINKRPKVFSLRKKKIRSATDSLQQNS